MSVEIKENILLKNYSSFKIGGEARYFCICRKEDEIKEALDFAINKKLKVFILGNGTNILISDKGFNGLVIKLQNDEVDIQKNSDRFDVFVESGKSFSALVFELAKKGISGLEWGSGIPAFVGGAICSNAGAFGEDMAKSVKSVRILDLSLSEEGYLEKYEKKELDSSKCDFSYRNSIFKNSKNFVILGGVLNLEKGNSKKLQIEVKNIIQRRNQKQPLEYPNIGSIFKNPKLTSEQFNRLIKECSEEKIAELEKGISAGFLIDRIGFKGKRVGGAMVSEKHANFIVNTGDAKSEDVVILIGLIKQKVRQKFGVQLYEEIEYVGF